MSSLPRLNLLYTSPEAVFTAFTAVEGSAFDVPAMQQGLAVRDVYSIANLAIHITYASHMYIYAHQITDSGSTCRRRYGPRIPPVVASMRLACARVRCRRY